MSVDPRLDRLSINHKTVEGWALPDFVDGVAAAGLQAIGTWREPVAEYGLDRTAKLVRDAGLRVSSHCRGGFLTAVEPEARAAAVGDNRRAIDEAATLGAESLVMVVGGLPAGSRDLAGARERVADALAELAPHAGERGVRLSLEALHPMYCADRAVLSTLAQALDLAAPFPVEQVGVVVDTFHVWWDPEVWRSIERAGERIASFQVCDFLVPIPADVLMARGYMGDGVIDFPPFVAAVEAAGWTGDVEVEIFNTDVWAQPKAQVVETVKQRYLDVVVPG
ncbi:sugar phosphate isomerase/epimerase [Geodermatophilus bullaregiensis]|uniref:sugar phosphate isomerase/epimerase family protein n=1 Tax=Geodermatophilus bullaregiensis TaxID=1564160 RepID=UPI0027DE6685|nr:sugar phosphate isomerase/epimerase family protein [Geodermatophilus bullaregiensis]MBM7807920.1 sugar phosphate isomerase/epimerase [Geodermatophilus bullaregiensis]